MSNGTIGQQRTNQLRRIEVLRTARYGGYGYNWFYKDDYKDATAYLLQNGFIEELVGYPEHEPRPFRLTEQGKQFIEQEVLPKIGSLKRLNVDKLKTAQINWP